MRKAILPFLLSYFVAHAIIAQDCSTLVLEVTNKSSYNGFNISCMGSSNGSFTVAASGGEAPYLFSINESVWISSGVFTGLPAGDYTAMVRDVNNCEKQIVVTLTAPTFLTGTASVTSNYNGQHLSCNGNSDGTITAVGSGGASPYTFSLEEFPANTTGNSTGVYTNLSAGIYSIKITDLNSCNVLTPTITIDPPPAVVAATAITSNYNGSHVSCFGASDGELTVIASGGTGSYFYSLNEMPGNVTGAFSGIFTGLPAGGTYSVRVRDLNNCSVNSLPVVISQPNIIAGTVSGAPVTCYQDSNATLTISASGGTGGHSYRLNEQPFNTTGNISGVFTNLPAGSYSIRIQDVNACEYTTAPYVIAQPGPISMETSFSEGSPGNCSDAQIVASASGGTAPYQYELNETQNVSGIFGGLANGSYVVTVTDANNCYQQTPPVVISQPSTIAASASVGSNYNGAMISCSGKADGVVAVTATGSSGFNFQSIETPANTSGSVSGIFTGLSAGSYTFIVQDENGCEKLTAPVMLTSPSELTIEGHVSSDYHGAQLTCFDAADGEITLQGEGGTGLYSYTIVDLSSNTTGATSGVFTGLAAGSYVLTVTDQNACDATTSAITITAPGEITVQGEINPDQNGNDGSVMLSVTGGTTPYSFSWSNESTEQYLTNVAAGEYEVEILDANACSVTESFIVPMIVGVEDHQNDRNVTIGFDTELREFYLTYTLASSANVSVKLFDANGKLGLELYARQFTGVQKQMLSRQMLQRGMYIAHVRIDEKLYIRKFVVL